MRVCERLIADSLIASGGEFEKVNELRGCRLRVGRLLLCA